MSWGAGIRLLGAAPLAWHADAREAWTAGERPRRRRRRYRAVGLGELEEGQKLVSQLTVMMGQLN